MDNEEVRDIPAPRRSGGTGRPDAGTVLLIVNTVIAAVGASYAGTHSVAITVTAGCAGVATAALAVWSRSLTPVRSSSASRQELSRYKSSRLARSADAVNSRGVRSFRAERRIVHDTGWRGRGFPGAGGANDG
jgi:hypothetical protein